ncbi:MAG: hypothetical protein IJ237_08885 [Oscillospiraceae bacterium]|nr:hypothetical protein [Oscillospiraceae bacterium]
MVLRVNGMKKIRFFAILAVLVIALACLSAAAFADTVVVCGQEVSPKVTRIDLTGMTESDVKGFVSAAPQLTRLRTVELGDETTTILSWDSIRRMQEAAPKAHFHYSFHLYSVPMTLEEEYIDLRRISIKDDAEALVAALPCLKEARFLDLDTCDLPEERILQIRGAFPEIKVIWRVTFSTGYSVRTDVKTILASYVGDFGLTDDASCKPLTYCRDVVNLDLGHNNIMTTLDFVRNMPNLEVLIVAKDDIKDISALAECKKLRYLELFKNPRITDLSPLASLTELRDLEIGLLPNVTDLSPLYDLELDRLWIGTQTGIPAEQVAEYSKRHPNCVINLTDDDIDNTWRYKETHGGAAPAVLWPQYQEIREIFGYGNESSWSFAGNDPYFYMGPGMIPHEETVKEEKTLVVQELEVSPEDDFLDLTGLTSSEVPAAIDVIRQLPLLDTVELGNDTLSKLTWEEISALQEAAPNAEFLYSFTLYGKTFTLSDETMDLNHIPIDDNGALVRQVIGCMPHLQVLDMDTCGVDNEHMARLRDAFPNIKVIWRIWFGTNYTVRTDVKKILASMPSVGGDLTPENTRTLKYCTEVKYLDVGHNEILRDISFAAYMPDLEVAIFAMLNFTDLTPLANCTKLEYLEIQTNKIADLSPLKNLTGLHHLNLGFNTDIHDLSPLYGLTNLERLWIGKFTSIPQAQVDEMQRLVPNCVIDVEATDPHAGWRYGNERYELLVKQFGYDTQDYAFPWKDPLFLPH